VDDSVEVENDVAVQIVDYLAGVLTAGSFDL
jgi:hypothetical protein